MSGWKRMLCKNMLSNGRCNYEKSCMYAHSLNDQLLLNVRHRVYNILIRKTDLSSINLVMDTELLDGIKSLTRTCLDCEAKTCVGGYNCRNGAVSTKLTICDRDFRSGDCKNINCNMVHLTKQGLIPYYTQSSETSSLASPIIVSDILRIKDLDFAKRSGCAKKYIDLDDSSDTDSDDILTEVLCVYNLNETIFD